MARIVLAMGGQKATRTLTNRTSDAIMDFYRNHLGQKPVDPNDPQAGMRDATTEEVLTYVLARVVGPYVDSLRSAREAELRAAFEADVAALQAESVDVFTGD